MKVWIGVRAHVLHRWACCVYWACCVDGAGCVEKACAPSKVVSHGETSQASVKPSRGAAMTAHRKFSPTANRKPSPQASPRTKTCDQPAGLPYQHNNSGVKHVVKAAAHDAVRGIGQRRPSVHETGQLHLHQREQVVARNHVADVDLQVGGMRAWTCAMLCKC
eukprot:354205-Chlamydomonas_euryale.AAC.3